MELRGPEGVGRGFRWLGRTGRVLLAVMVLAGTALACGFGMFLISLQRVEQDPARSADAIVVLTGGQQRVEDAIALLGRGFGKRLLITGVNERTSRDEIARLSPQLGDLVSCCVDLDYRARDTVGNAAETRRWARDHGFRSLIVVTSNYHMPRTLAELERVLPDVAVVPHVIIGSVRVEMLWQQPGALRLLAAEYAKFLTVKVRAHLSGAPPAVSEPHPLRTVASPAAAR